MWFSVQTEEVREDFTGLLLGQGVSFGPFLQAGGEQGVFLCDKSNLKCCLSLHLPL